MNSAPHQDKFYESIPRINKSKDEDNKLWTTEAVIDKLELYLRSFVDEENDKKYEKQAKKLIYKIPIYRNLPFVVEKKDLSQRLLRELATYDEVGQQKVLKAAVARIFEDINPTYFKQSVERLLVVEVSDH